MNDESIEDRSALDALALILDRENTRLRDLEYRLNSLRHALIAGDTDFVQTAAEHWMCVPRFEPGLRRASPDVLAATQL